MFVLPIGLYSISMFKWGYNCIKKYKTLLAFNFTDLKPFMEIWNENIYEKNKFNSFVYKVVSKLYSSPTHLFV